MTSGLVRERTSSRPLSVSRSCQDSDVAAALLSKGDAVAQLCKNQQKGRMLRCFRPL